MMNIRQFGDFQTPPELVDLILKRLGPIGRRWKRVLEPTCGRGNFIRGIVQSEAPPDEIIGIELQESYIEEARADLGSKALIIHDDIFRIDLKKELNWKSDGPLLVIGNPPWVTNSEMGALRGSNLPRKNNLKALQGLDAITGKSNFDLAEYIWIKLIRELADDRATVALLCKTSVARNVIKYARQNDLLVSCGELARIDSKKWFGAAVDAGLLTLCTGIEKRLYQLNVFDSLHQARPGSRIAFVGKHLIRDLDSYESVSFLEGDSHFEWRQGVKHDAAQVLELVKEKGGWKNGFGDKVEVEDEYIHPLLKSSDLKVYSEERRIKHYVIIPQQQLNQNTSGLKIIAPKLWRYLEEHAKSFAKRKSSIYKNKGPFSVFGIGPYSFSPYKVIISGLYKEPKFVAVGPVLGKPVMCDDTCYLLPCDSPTQAAVMEAILNHELSRKFFNSVIFHDSKRPITKSVLSRIDIIELAKRIRPREVSDKIVFALKAMQNSREDGNPTIPSDLVEALEPGNIVEQPTLFDWQ